LNLCGQFHDVLLCSVNALHLNTKKHILFSEYKMAETFEVPPLLEKELRALIKSGYYGSVEDALKDAVRTLLRVNPDLRTVTAVELYKEGEISLGKAAEIAGVTTIEFKDILVDRGIRRNVGSRSAEELKAGVKLLERSSR
jgi:predicted HTH domain antitoxin